MFILTWVKTPVSHMKLHIAIIDTPIGIDLVVWRGEGKTGVPGTTPSHRHDIPTQQLQCFNDSKACK